MYDFKVDYGDGVRLCASLAALCEEIVKHPEFQNLTNLGELGDQRHTTEGYSSDHNPFIVNPHNKAHLIRAIDLGGDQALLRKLRDHMNRLYAFGDDRLWRFGYTKGPDSQITTWTDAPTGRIQLHTDTGDEGHLHISVTQADGYNPSPSGWVSAISTPRPWGIFPHEDPQHIAAVSSHAWNRARAERRAHRHK